ncbi:hypothetical protein ElyMa_003935100 [Elysia marginata]|uniref:DUF7869 domain-containing protein n=1 Tax=Elysia marginata TaxID=1093978 RepID=A0AAV4FS90_9GAST|nr:hypothetical protein ElyMa_003935100 [Elysia marginata]
MRQEREKDRALKTDDTAVISFDLENVITCPKVEISNFFYKRKLTVYNLTGHVVVNGVKQVYCVIWTECLAGRGGNEIASALLKIFQDVVLNNPTVQNIITWSDSCVSQNRNHFMSTAVMMFLSQNQHIKSVLMKYSIAGHSCVQEVDNVHSQLEKSFNVSEFFSPLSLIRVILKTNKNKPFRVIQLKNSDCFDFQKSGKPLNFKGIPYFQACALHFRSNSFEVGFKHSFSQADFIYSNTNTKATTRNGRACPVTLADLLLNPKPQGLISLSDAKKKDLQSMLKFMPEQDKEYFNTILKI